MLLIQKARPHDALCARVCGPPEKAVDVKMGSGTHATVECDATSLPESGSECPICMEPFQPGQYVSWSSHTTVCRHAFHHQCIKEWLLHHRNCPFCREILLWVDDDNNNDTGKHALTTTTKPKVSSSMLRQHTIQRATVAATTYFCLHDGLVQVSHARRCCSISATNATDTKQNKPCRPGGRFVSTIDNDMVQLMGITVKGKELSQLRGPMVAADHDENSKLDESLQV
jgi:hypothetical protein